MFRSQYDKRQRYFADPGSKTYFTYRLTYDDNGKEILIPDKEISMYDEIQSHADSVDIHVLIDRYERGDLEALTSREGQYADIIDMPKTLAELYQRTKDTEYYFNGLPLETREKYNFSASEFLASYAKEDNDEQKR